MMMFQECLNRCQVCDDYITEGSVDAEGLSFHPSCFTCKQCGLILTGEFYVGPSGDFICPEDYKVNKELIEKLFSLAHPTPIVSGFLKIRPYRNYNPRRLRERVIFNEVLQLFSQMWSYNTSLYLSSAQLVLSF